jgi:hypothetical protein
MHILTGKEKNPSGSILKDYWVNTHPGYRRSPKASRTFKAPIEKPVGAKSITEALEGLRTYWIPGRSSDPFVDKGPVAAMRAGVKRIDPRLRISWNPKEQLWGIWTIAPQIKTDWCKGWKLLFSVKSGFVDQRILWRLYQADVTQYGGAKVAYEKFIAGIAARNVKVDKKMRANDRAWASDYFDHTRPQVGYGTVNNGRKVAKHG